ALLALVAGLVLSGWIWSVPTLRGAYQGVNMAPATALLFVLVGTAGALLTVARLARAGQAVGGVVAIIAAWFGANRVLGGGTADSTLIAWLHLPGPGRMAAATSFCFLLLG